MPIKFETCEKLISLYNEEKLIWKESIEIIIILLIYGFPLESKWQQVSLSFQDFS